jgi:hypothetical protein
MDAFGPEPPRAVPCVGTVPVAGVLCYLFRESAQNRSEIGSDLFDTDLSKGSAERSPFLTFGHIYGPRTSSGPRENVVRSGTFPSSAQGKGKRVFSEEVRPVPGPRRRRGRRPPVPGTRGWARSVEQSADRGTREKNVIICADIRMTDGTWKLRSVLLPEGVKDPIRGAGEAGARWGPAVRDDSDPRKVSDGGRYISEDPPHRGAGLFGVPVAGAATTRPKKCHSFLRNVDG